MSNITFTYLLRLADTTLILSHRLSELCGKGPVLEEDMAMANIALDLLGQSRQWLTYAGEMECAGRDEDALAYLRSDREFFSFLLVERPNGSYADTLTRQFYFDAWHSLALRQLLRSSDARVAAISEKSLKEVTYHLRRSSGLLIRLGDGTKTSQAMMQAAADALWPYTGEMFVGDAVDAVAAEAGIGFDPAALKQPWLDYVRDVFEEATLKPPATGIWMHNGGKQGLHTEALGYLLAEMQTLQRSYPGARW